MSGPGSSPGGAGGRRLGARAVHRLTGDDVGRRASVRHAPGDDGSVTDVVGRLLAAQDGTLVLVDRHGQLHVLDERRVVASKVVPEHPRRAAEPVDLGTQGRPLPRDAARALVLDDDGRVLLAAHTPRPGRRVWTAPGGGLRPGEDHAAAVQRELAEELGLHDPPVGPWVWSRRVTFTFAGVWLDQTERWFLVPGVTLDPATAPLDDVGLDGLRWWTPAQLAATDETLAPGSLAHHLDVLRRHGPPAHPIDVGR